MENRRSSGDTQRHVAAKRIGWGFGSASSPLLTSMVGKGNPAIGMIGIPSFDGLKHGQEPYVEKLLDENWVTESLNESMKNCIWMIERNPPRPQKA